MHVILTCEYEKDRIKNGREKVAIPGFFSVITLSVAMETITRIWPNFKLIQALVSWLPASMKWIRSRTAQKKWQHRFSRYKYMGIYFRRSRAANSAVGGRNWLNFKLIQALMYVMVTCKYEKDPIKNL